MKHALLSCVLVLLASVAFATPPNVPILDGRPIEYDATDLRATFGAEPTWTTVTVSNLFVTWDSTHLYIGYQAWLQSDKLVVIIDADPEAGTGATTTTNWLGFDPDFPGYIKFNEFGWVDTGGTFGLDYMLASEGTYNNIIRVLYDGTGFDDTNQIVALFDNGNRNVPTGGTLDMVCERNATLCPHQGLEAKIPWSVFYGAEGRFGVIEAGETVPRGAKIRLLAGVHNNKENDIYSSPDTLPRQTGGAWADGILTNPEYVDIVIDANSNGIPDMLTGDYNAPWIRAASGAVGGTNLYVAFSEPVTGGTVEDPGNWSVGGVVPSSAVAQSANIVLLELPAPISSTDLLLIRANGVQDAALNSRPVEHCLFPAASGIPLPVTVTFQVNTNSGMGISSTHPKPSAFFINGSSLPIEWGYSGYPPFESTPLTPIPGSNGWASRSVTFLAGSPSELFYKYSARINGTNNYEAIRLTGFDSVSRPLTLNTNGAPMTVKDYLGSAAHPLRNPGDTNLPSAQNRLFTDPQRSDAGVRVRREILFQLDLSMRNTNNLARVMVLGSDPLRGFNDNGDNEGGTASDFPDNSAYVDWDAAGIPLVDDGTLGDVAAGDGIYSRLWAFSTDGYDAAIEPNSPYSLVGGATAVYVPEEIPGTEPYLGDTYWVARRSPRSLIYKFYVYTAGGNNYDSPNTDLSYYVADPNETAQIVLDPFVWDDDALPPPPPSNAPAMTGVSIVGTAATVQFENVPTEGSHGVKISTNLISGFDNYGHRAVAGATNENGRQWSAAISEASPAREFYAAYAGEAVPIPPRWEPEVVTNVATTGRVYFCQYQTGLQGMRSLGVTGITDWSTEQPMTFLGNGVWMADIPLPEVPWGTLVECNFKRGATWAGIANAYSFRGGDPCSWTPKIPVSGEPFTVTLDISAPGAYFKDGGPILSSATNMFIHLGYDAGWLEASSRQMTNTFESIWEYSTVIPSNYTTSVNWVFKGYVNGGEKWYPAVDRKVFMQSPTTLP